MPHQTPSPLDLPEPDLEETSALGWATGIILFASLLLLLVNAVSVRDWIDEQPASPAQARAAEIADDWVAITRQIGFGVPRDTLHAQWKRAEGARFDQDGRIVMPADEPPAEDQR
jgi:hypothetical protein